MANASRRIKEAEWDNAQANGIEPVELVVAGDAIAIVVHPDNPVEGLTIPQLAAIFSGQVTNWREVGGEDRPIVLLSRESNSGTHVFFLEQVVRQGDKKDTTLFSPDTLLMPSSEGISAEVRQNPNAIGYDGLGYVTHDQKVVAVAPAAGDPLVMPTVETVKNGSYPVARGLYIYTDGEPQGAILEYLDWILGPEGQAIVQDLGFVPLQ
jgi:phosphate transport system substrate-binding protein